MESAAGKPAEAFTQRQDGAAWRSMQQQQLQREYSPSSCIGGDYRPFIDAYIRQSREARARCQDLGGVWSAHAYGAKPAERLDLCLPAWRSDALAKPGLLVFIHGGYWQELSAQESLFAASGCIERGLAFAALDYTLAPKATLEQIVAECRSALTWLFEHAEELGFDAGRVVVAGSSAGAHLAAMVALHVWPDAAVAAPFKLRAGVFRERMLAQHPFEVFRGAVADVVEFLLLSS